MKDTRYFLLDKNYLLKEAQEQLKMKLLGQMMERVKVGYDRLYNPLGFQDDTTKSIHDYQLEDSFPFDMFYEQLCAVYRFEIGTNQLEFLFDGSDQYSKYLKDWEQDFNSYMDIFCSKRKFIKTVLSLTLFFTSRQSALLAENRLRSYITESFGVKFYKQKGIKKVA